MWETITNEESSETIATADDLSTFSARYNLVLPDDYKAFHAIFGEGVLFNHFRIWGLSKIGKELEEIRERWQAFYRWTDPASALSEDEIADCVIIGDSFNADELVLSPAHPNEIFYLPADKDKIVSLGVSLEGAINSLVEDLRKEVARYPEDEQEEWDLRPVFNCEDF